MIYLATQKITWKIWIWFSEDGRSSVDADGNEKCDDDRVDHRSNDEYEAIF